MASPGSTNISAGFCDGPLWDTELLLSSSWPRLTQCFQDTLLTYIPFACFWLPLPMYMYDLASTGGTSPLPLSCFAVLKMFLAASSSLLSLITIIDDYGRDSMYAPVSTAHTLAKVIRLVTYAAAVLVVNFERKYRISSSGILFLFWTLASLCDIVPLYSKIMLEEYKTSLMQFVLFILIYMAELIQAMLNCFVDPSSDEIFQERASPEVTASFPSQYFYWWITKTVYTGWKGDLTERDLFDLNPRDSSDTLIPVFERHWVSEVAYHKRKSKRLDKQLPASSPQYIAYDMTDLSSSYASSQFINEDDESAPLLGADMNGKVRERRSNKHSVAFAEAQTAVTMKKDRPSLLKVLTRMMGPRLVVGLVQKVVSDVFLLASPVLLSLLISYADNREGDYAWKGFTLAALLFLSQMFKSVLFNVSFWASQIVGMQLKSILIAAIYKKALTMSNEAKKESTAGEIVNLMSVDCQRIMEVMNFFFFAWTTPLQVIAAIAILYQYIGVSAIAGLAVLLLTVPFNSYLATRQQKLQVANLELKDSRLRLTNEALAGMKVLKLYAWEPAFQQKISEIRDQETRVLLNIAYLNAMISVCFNIAPYLVMLVTFAVYVNVSEENHLDANKAFVALSFFNLLRVPLSLLSTIISMSVQAAVSIKRINAFLCTGDINRDNIRKDSRAAFAIDIENGTFTWDKGSSPSLADINLHIPEGKLFAVVGPVGSGKSSLMAALLGEMERLRGRASIKSKVAYVPQQAWIQNATVRDNILFGKPYDARKYKKVLYACALERDLEILSAGDMTEIGEKGINLSGGQKQRVSLARAVYSNADIYILDDPLSAVDTHVGKHIFTHVVGERGLLRGKTRVLVTHGAHWLPIVDTIVVLDEGRITETGSYEDLMAQSGAFSEFIRTYLLNGDEDSKSEDEDPEIQAIKSKIRSDAELSDHATSRSELGRPPSKRRASERQSISRSLPKLRAVRHAFSQGPPLLSPLGASWDRTTATSPLDPHTARVGSFQDEAAIMNTSLPWELWLCPIVPLCLCATSFISSISYDLIPGSGQGPAQREQIQCIVPPNQDTSLGEGSSTNVQASSPLHHVSPLSHPEPGPVIFKTTAETGTLGAIEQIDTQNRWSCPDSALRQDTVQAINATKTERGKSSTVKQIEPPDQWLNHNPVLRQGYIEVTQTAQTERSNPDKQIDTQNKQKSSVQTTSSTVLPEIANLGTTVTIEQRNTQNHRFNHNLALGQDFVQAIPTPSAERDSVGTVEQRRTQNHWVNDNSGLIQNSVQAISMSTETANSGTTEQINPPNHWHNPDPISLQDSVQTLPPFGGARPKTCNTYFRSRGAGHHQTTDVAQGKASLRRSREPHRQLTVTATSSSPENVSPCQQASKPPRQNLGEIPDGDSTGVVTEAPDLTGITVTAMAHDPLRLRSSGLDPGLSTHNGQPPCESPTTQRDKRGRKRKRSPSCKSAPSLHSPQAALPALEPVDSSSRRPSPRPLLNVTPPSNISSFGSPQFQPPPTPPLGSPSSSSKLSQAAALSPCKTPPKGQDLHEDANLRVNPQGWGSEISSASMSIDDPNLAHSSASVQDSGLHSSSPSRLPRGIAVQDLHELSLSLLQENDAPPRESTPPRSLSPKTYEKLQKKAKAKQQGQQGQGARPLNLEPPSRPPTPVPVLCEDLPPRTPSPHRNIFLDPPLLSEAQPSDLPPYLLEELGLRAFPNQEDPHPGNQPSQERAQATAPQDSNSQPSHVIAQKTPPVHSKSHSSQGRAHKTSPLQQDEQLSYDRARKTPSSRGFLSALLAQTGQSLTSSDNLSDENLVLPREHGSPRTQEENILPETLKELGLEILPAGDELLSVPSSQGMTPSSAQGDNSARYLPCKVSSNDESPEENQPRTLPGQLLSSRVPSSLLSQPPPTLESSHQMLEQTGPSSHVSPQQLLQELTSSDFQSCQTLVASGQAQARTPAMLLQSHPPDYVPSQPSLADLQTLQGQQPRTPLSQLWPRGAPSSQPLLQELTSSDSQSYETPVESSQAQARTPATLLLSHPPDYISSQPLLADLQTLQGQQPRTPLSQLWPRGATSSQPPVQELTSSDSQSYQTPVESGQAQARTPAMLLQSHPHVSSQLSSADLLTLQGQQPRTPLSQLWPRGALSSQPPVQELTSSDSQSYQTPVASGQAQARTPAMLQPTRPTDYVSSPPSLADVLTLQGQQPRTPLSQLWPRGALSSQQGPTSPQLSSQFPVSSASPPPPVSEYECCHPHTPSSQRWPFAHPPPPPPALSSSPDSRTPESRYKAGARESGPQLPGQLASSFPLPPTQRTPRRDYGRIYTPVGELSMEDIPPEPQRAPPPLPPRNPCLQDGQSCARPSQKGSQLPPQQPSLSLMLQKPPELPPRQPFVCAPSSPPPRNTQLQPPRQPLTSPNHQHPGSLTHSKPSSSSPSPPSTKSSSRDQELSVSTPDSPDPGSVLGSLSHGGVSLNHTEAVVTFAKQVLENFQTTHTVRYSNTPALKGQTSSLSNTSTLPENSKPEPKSAPPTPVASSKPLSKKQNHGANAKPIGKRRFSKTRSRPVQGHASPSKLPSNHTLPNKAAGVDPSTTEGNQNAKKTNLRAASRKQLSNLVEGDSSQTSTSLTIQKPPNRRKSSKSRQNNTKPVHKGYMCDEDAPLFTKQLKGSEEVGKLDRANPNSYAEFRPLAYGKLSNKARHRKSLRTKASTNPYVPFIPVANRRFQGERNKERQKTELASASQTSFQGAAASNPIQVEASAASQSEFIDDTPARIYQCSAFLKNYDKARPVDTMSMIYESSFTASGTHQSKALIYNEDDGDKTKGRLVQDEKMEKGKVKLAVFWTYTRAMGWLVMSAAFVLFALFQGVSAGANFWLNSWTGDTYLANTSHIGSDQYKETNDYYLGIFGLFGIIQVIFLVIHNVLYWIRMVIAAKRLHAGMLASIFRSPMSFFDTTPLGRIMNRFSRDIEVVDNMLPLIVRDYINSMFTSLVTLAVISISSPLFLTLVIPILVIYLFIQNFYIPTSRQLKRIESVTRSPVYTHFSETISGGPTIRAYDASLRFMRESKNRVDRNQSFYYISLAANRWLGMNLEILANFVILGSAVFAVLTPGISGGFVGLSVSYAIQVSSNLTWMVRQMSDLETNIVSVERLKEYSELDSEAEWVVPHHRPVPDWPLDGEVRFTDYQTRYRPGLDLVLRGITCSFKAGEKVGIVGRTGAGKSSLALALFRLIEASSGSISVDGINLGEIGLHDVRSRLTILPQDPVLFFGSLRMNLDPLELYNDAQLWAALTRAHLRNFVLGLPEGLDYPVGEEGQSLSVGQRQLVCLARALLKKTQILILDEATAAVDMETDTLIQHTIRSEFEMCTIITIAHRLNTIMDYDRIMVLDAGRIEEFDSPGNLLADTQSIFYSMAKEANLVA